MNAPTGYTELSLVGFTDKGDYSASATYVKNDLVNYRGVKWRCKVDDVSNVAPSEGVRWTKFIVSEMRLRDVIELPDSPDDIVYRIPRVFFSSQTVVFTQSDSDNAYMLESIYGWYAPGTPTGTPIKVYPPMSPSYYINVGTTSAPEYHAIKYILLAAVENPSHIDVVYETASGTSTLQTLYNGETTIDISLYPGTVMGYDLYAGISADDSYSKIVTSDLAKEPQNITNRVGYLTAAIAEQDLEKYGYKIGDYFTGTGATPYKYYLADLNTFYDAGITDNHVAVIVHTGVKQKWKNSTSNTYTYYTSDLSQYLTSTVLSQITTDIASLLGGTGGDHLCAHNVSTPDYDFSNLSIVALTEMQVCGAHVLGLNNTEDGEGQRQLEIFRKKNPGQVFGTANVQTWLRNVVGGHGDCCAGMTNSYGVGYAHWYEEKYVSALIMLK